jgi:LacI family transcriptional regulator
MGKRVDGLVVSARRADKRLADRPVRPWPAGGLCLTQADDPDALCLLPDDEGGAVLAVEHLPAAAARMPTSPAPSIRPVQLRNRHHAALAAGLPARDCFYLRKLVGSVGPRCRRAAFDGRQSTRRCSAGTTRSPAAWPMAARTRHRRAFDVAIVARDWDVMALAARPPLSSIDMNLKAPGARPETADRHDCRQAGERRPATALLAGGAAILGRLTGHETCEEQ